MNKEQTIMNGPSMIEASDKRSIKKLVRSRGFDENGIYEFEENLNTSKEREPGNINNGFVTGHFDTGIDEPIILRKNDFLSASWRRICSSMGYPYNDANEIDCFIISKNGIRVEVDIKTPDEYDLESASKYLNITDAAIDTSSTGRYISDSVKITNSNMSKKDKGISEYLNS